MKKKIFIVILAVLMLTATVYASDKITVKEIASGLDFDEVGQFNDGLARVKLDGKDGYINKSGKLIITIEYDEVGNFSNGMAWIRKGDKYGYIDKSGDVVIPIDYDCYFGESSTYPIIPEFSEGLAAISIDGKCGFIDKTGKFVIPAIYDGDFWRGEWWNYIPKFNDGIVRVRKDDKAGCIDKTGKVIIPFEYYWLANGWTGFFCEGLACIDKYDENNERKRGLIDKNGHFVVPLGYYDAISDFNGSLAYVMKYDISREYGAYIDRTGKLVTKFEYYTDQWQWWYYEKSSEGLTIAQKDGKMGCLDEKGNIAVPFEYDIINPFSDGLAYVYNRNPSVCGYVDKTGNLVITGDYNGISHSFSNGLVWASKENKYGYIDISGELIVPLIYDYANDFSEGLAFVKKDDKWAILEIQNYQAPKTGDSLRFILLTSVCSAIILTGFRKIKKK